MAPRLSISLLVLLFVFYSSLLSTAFAGRPGSHPPDPLGEPRPDPAPAPAAGAPVAAGAPAPFSETGKHLSHLCRTNTTQPNLATR